MSDSEQSIIDFYLFYMYNYTIIQEVGFYEFKKENNYQHMSVHVHFRRSAHNRHIH